jgi:hypothetical protein
LGKGRSDDGNPDAEGFDPASHGGLYMSLWIRFSEAGLLYERSTFGY